MALTVEAIKKEETLASLTPEQINAIVNLSLQDENTVIGTRIGEIHGSYEQDIFKLTNIPKKDGEKAYDYNKRVLTQYTTELDNLKKTVETVKAEKTSLEEQLKKGSTDEALKTKIDQLTKDLKDAQDAVKAKDELVNKVTEKAKTDLINTKVDFQFAQANSSIKLKSAYPDSIKQTLIDQAKNEILSKYVPDFVVDNTGKESLVFRDKTTNEIVRNPNNGLNPYTIQDLYSTTVLKDAIDTGRNIPGGGTVNVPGNNNNSVIDLSGVKTQKEADDIIYTHLMQKGLARGTQEFYQEQVKLREENEVSKLPIR